MINELGHRLFDAIGEQIYQLQAVHCDPHPGNFAFRPDGSLIIYDYGCIKEIKPEIVEFFRVIAQAAINHDYEGIEKQLIQIGVRNTEHVPHIGGDFYAPWVTIALKAFDDQPFDFAKATLHEDITKQARKSLKYWDAFQPSPDTLLVDRAIGGHYWTLKQLGVNTAFRNNLLRNIEHRSTP
jgi:hypothetical protein